LRRVLIGVAAALTLAAPAQAAEITVTTFEDAGNALCPAANGLPCTLRRAIELSKTNGGTDSPDTIVLSAGTYELSSNFGALATSTTNQGVTIAGAGADKTVIRGAGDARVLEVQGESSFTLRGLTVTGGRSLGAPGGNIHVSVGELRLDHVRLTDGHSTRGGGLAVDNGEALIQHSLIDGNTATQDGGGIASFGGSTTSLLTSTVTGNSAAEGGAIAVSNQQTVSTQLVLSTVAHNTATGWSGGGIAVRLTAAAPTVVGSILAGNIGFGVPGNPPQERNCSGTIVDGGGNVESRFECAFTRPESRQAPITGLAPALVSDGGTLPVLPISADSPARELAGPCSGTDQRDVQRPFGAACDAGAYEYVAPPPPVVTPTPTPAPPVATPAPTPTPVVNRTIVVAEERGTVKVKLPRTNRYVDLNDIQGIPVGSEVDTRKGSVRLTSIPKAGAQPETAIFYDGIFKVTQSKGITNLTLSEPLAACPKRKARAAAKKAKKRRLWGDGKGSFRTTGRHSAATVRGTKWLVEDSCAGTLTRVTQGSVTVRDFSKPRGLIVRAGKRYLARPRR
jgi:hypothetical protein